MLPQTGPFVLFELPSGLPEMWQSLAVVFTERSPKACILLASERPEVLRIQENLVRTLPIPVLVFWENNFLQNPRVERCQDTLSMATHACGNVVDSIESRDRAENLWGIRTACISARDLFENVPLLEALAKSTLWRGGALDQQGRGQKDAAEFMEKLLEVMEAELRGSQHPQH